jgi:hypothetical protein
LNEQSAPTTLTSIAAAIALSTSAAGQELPACGDLRCETRRECETVVYPCGEEPDGTVFFCSEEQCQDVVVCTPVTPCVGEPLPGFPDLPDFPDLPGLP